MPYIGILEKIRRRIEFRLSGSELFDGGYGLEEGCRIAQQIEPYIDLLHVSAGTYQRGFGDTHPSMFKAHGCNVYLAAEIKKHVSVPVATIGGLNDPSQMEEIIAVGSAPLVPPIPGLDRENVVVVNNYYLEKEKVGDDVVVFGGGLAGCECAIHLGMEGKTVHLVEMRDELAPDANVRHRPLLLKEIDKYVTVHTGMKGLEVTAERILCEDKAGNQELIPGTSVICALGQRSRSDCVEALRDAAPYVAVIGDAAKVSTITNAVYLGYHAALDI